MRLLAYVLALTALVCMSSCGPDSTGPAFLDRSYVLKYRVPDSMAVPATIHYGGTVSDIADSGRLELNPDSSFEARVWITEQLNPCRLNYPNNFCPTYKQVIDSARGTYRITPEGVEMTLQGRAWQVKPSKDPFFIGPVGGDQASPQTIDLLSTWSVYYYRFQLVEQPQ